MQRPLRIGLDIDGVLADTDRPALEAIGRHYGRQLDIDDWRSWRLSDSFPDLPGVDESSDSLFSDEAFMSSLPYVPGAIWGTFALARRGHRLFYVTSRAERLRSCTGRWLGANSFPIGELLIAPGSKVGIAWELKLDLFVEDSARNALELAEVCPVYLFDYPWNREVNHPNITRVSGWREFMRKVAQCLSRSR